MRVLLQRSILGALCMALIVCLFATLAPAQRRHRMAASVPVKDPKRAADAQRHSRDASKVFREVMGTPDKGIPKDLLDKAEAVGVFPGVLKAGLGIGGFNGKGVISRRVPGGWSAPAFFNMRGGDIGAQIGGEKIDFVLLFMNEDALNALLKDKVEIGGELSAAAGPVGRTAAASTDAQLKAGILTYSRSKGAFIGAVIKGGTISPDNDLNEAVYGMKAKDFLNSPESVKMADVPTVVRIFPETLADYSRK